MPIVSPFTSNRRWLKAGVNRSGTELGLSLRWQIPLCAWKKGWQISLSGSVSASLYRTYTVQVTAMLGDMEDFFTYRGVIGLSILNIIKWQRIEFIKIRFE